MVLQAILNNGFLIPVSMPNYQIQPAAKFNPQSARERGRPSSLKSLAILAQS